MVEYSAFVRRASSDVEHSRQGWYGRFLGVGLVWLMNFECHFAGPLIMSHFAPTTFLRR